MLISRSRLSQIYFKNVPKARWINPFFRESFNLLFDCSEFSRGRNVLNIVSSRDLSSKREKVFREHFFHSCHYSTIDFWEDNFLTEQGNYRSKVLPFDENSFDSIITTKVILEHTSDPATVIAEFFRVLKPSGKLFLIAPHIRRQHQKPHDYFRFTECILNKLLSEAGFQDVEITPTGGFMAMVGYYAYFVQRGLMLPLFIERLADIIVYWLIEPLCYLIDYFDNGYGRDMTMYFMCRAECPENTEKY